MVYIFRIMEQEQEINVSWFFQNVFFYSNEFEIIRKKFLNKNSKYNIRNTFDILQNMVQKAVDLINTWQKMIFNYDCNYNHGLSTWKIIKA